MAMAGSAVVRGTTAKSAGPKLLGAGKSSGGGGGGSAPPIIKAKKINTGGKKRSYKSSGYQSEYSYQYRRRQREYTRQHYRRQYANYKVRSRLQQERQTGISEEYDRRQAHYAAQRRNAALTKPFKATGRISEIGGAAVAPAKPAINPLLLIVFLWVAILVLYVMITTPGPTTGFFASLRSWIAVIYSPRPLFYTSPVVPPTTGGGAGKANDQGTKGTSG